MKTSIKRSVALVLFVVMLLSNLSIIPTASAADAEFHGDYTDAAKIYDSNSCPSMQGLAVGSQMLYAIKIKTDNTRAVITMTDKDSGTTTTLTDASTGYSYFTGLDHANDMAVWGIDSKSHIFVATTMQGSNAIVRYARSGSNLTKVATYHLQYNGSDICATAMDVMDVDSDGYIHLITKWGQDIYTGTVHKDTGDTTIAMTKLCTISKEMAYIKGEKLDLSSWVNQGFGYHDDTLFVPLSGPDDQLHRSVVLVYDLKDVTSGSTIYPTDSIVFRVTSGAYSALFEIESVDICSSDGKLYFNTNRRITDSNTNHDGISSFDDYTYSRPAAASFDNVKHFHCSYLPNGGTGTMEVQRILYGVSTPLSANGYTKTGYAFAGWTAHRLTQNQWFYTNGSTDAWYAEGAQPDGYSLYVYNDQQKVAKTSGVYDDTVEFVAQWTPIDYTITWNINGEQYAQTTARYGDTITAPSYTSIPTGYTFSGWDAPETMPAENLVLNATLTINSYDITWAVDGNTTTESYDYGQMPTFKGSTDKAPNGCTTYTFASWDKEIVAVTGNATYTAIYTEGISHTNIVTDAAVAATCTTTGLTEGSHCEACGTVIVAQNEVPTLGHSAGEAVTENEVAATCGADGSYDTVVYCAVCGEELSRETTVVPATGNHNYATEQERVEATCTVDGYVVMACGCGATEKTILTAPGHSAGEAVTENEVAADCTNDGSYDTVIYCSVCGEELSRKTTVVPALGHTDGEPVTENEVAPTCGADGSYDTVVYCAVCGEELSRETIVVPATGNHNYATEQERVEATCTVDGYVVMACGCGATEKTILTAPGHSAGEAVTENEVAADCTNDGSYDTVVYCAICGEELSRETTVVPALGHTDGEPVTENEVAPTCGAEGSYDTVIYCSVCGEELSRETTVVPATGNHNYATEQERVEATCTVDGYVIMACGCGATEKTILTAPGHSAGEAVTENEVTATCTTDGSYDTVVYCAVCGEELSRETTVVPHTGHSGDLVYTRNGDTHSAVYEGCGCVYVTGEAHTYIKDECVCGAYKTFTVTLKYYNQYGNAVTCGTVTKEKYQAVFFDQLDWWNTSEFLGWDEDGDGEVDCPDGAVYMIYKDATLYAVFTPYSVKVKLGADDATFFDKDGNPITTIYATSVYTSYIEMTDFPTRPGYTFVGWTDSMGSEYLVQTDPVTGEKYVGLLVDPYCPPVAMWEINTYTVNFVNEDGTMLQSSEITHGERPTAPTNPTMAPDGCTVYTFAGWDKDIVAVTEDTTYTATYTKSISHTNVVIDAAVAPDCTNTGLTEGSHCETCGTVFTAQEVIPSIGHTEETIPGYAATCTEDGLTDGVKCSVCGEILTAQEVIPSIGHTEETVPGYAATCTEDGLTDGVKCSVCGEILTAQEIIPAAGHGEVTYTDNLDGTHSAAYDCCGDAYVTGEAHTYDAETRRCVCGAVDTRKNGICAEDDGLYYYVDGKRTYAGLIKIDGEYYYVRSSGQLVTGRIYWVTKTNGLKPAGNYYFDSTGKISVKNGIVKESDGIYYYVDGKRNYAGLIRIDGNYYYVRSNGQVVTDRTYWVTKTNDLLPAASYYFDATGKMAPKGSLVEEDGGIYYYVDGNRTYAGLIRLDGNYYYVRSSGQVVTNRTYWVTKTNDLLPAANYQFDENGVMINPPA